MQEMLSNNERRAASDARRFLKAREVAEYFGVSIPTLRAWDCPCWIVGRARSGRGKRVRYELREVEAWLRQRSAEGLADRKEGEV